MRGAERRRGAGAAVRTRAGGCGQRRGRRPRLRWRQQRRGRPGAGAEAGLEAACGRHQRAAARALAAGEVPEGARVQAAGGAQAQGTPGAGVGGWGWDPAERRGPGPRTRPQRRLRAELRVPCPRGRPRRPGPCRGPTGRAAKRAGRGSASPSVSAREASGVPGDLHGAGRRLGLRPPRPGGTAPPAPPGPRDARGSSRASVSPAPHVVSRGLQSVIYEADTTASLSGRLRPRG